jgi:hypothetical protein
MSNFLITRYSTPTMTSAIELGLQLEELIHQSISKIQNIECLKEKDIRTYFNDHSFNGVDHWIKYNDIHILIQDKWKDTVSQPEIAQFLNCVERIQARNAKTDTYYLVWASKKEPTIHGLKTLHEKNVNIIYCSTSITSLARIVVLYICDTLNVDPVPSLLSIPSSKLMATSNISTREVIKLETYDDSAEGHVNKNNLIKIMQKIQNGPFIKITRWSIGQLSHDITSSMLPKSVDEWQQVKASTFNYSQLLKKIRKYSWPSKKNKISYLTLNNFIKLHYISKELSEMTKEYTNLRNELIIKKSTWAKGTLDLKCIYEPISSEEYSYAIKFTSDYRIGMENNFWMEYTAVW